MKKMLIKNSLVATMTVFTFAIAVPIVAAALPARAEESQAVAQEKQTTAANKKEMAQTRLTDAKLKACQHREKAITNIMARISDRGQKQIDLFDTIATRTETFYKSKGKVLSSYDSLVADVATKKADAQAAVDSTKSKAAEFKCDGTDPKGVASAFKDNLKTQNDALKAYKTSVKNLIVGVKSVQGSTTSADKISTGGNQ